MDFAEANNIFFYFFSKDLSVIDVFVTSQIISNCNCQYLQVDFFLENCVQYF